MTGLNIEYRNDPGAPSVSGNIARYGQTEWQDLNGHVNVRHYLELYDAASWPTLAALAPRSMAALLALLLSVSLPEFLGRAVQQRLEIAQQRVAREATDRPPAVDRVSLVQARQASS